MKSVKLVIFFGLLMDLVAFTMILPLLPSLLDYYGQRNDGLYSFIYESMVKFRAWLDIPDTPRWNSVLLGGMIGSLFSFLQCLSSPFTGSLSDVHGRKPILLLTLFGSVVSYLLFAVSSSFTLFVLSRVLGGLSKANTSLCIAVLTDVTDTKDRGRAMALVGIAYSLGFLIGPLVGAGFAKLIRLHPEMFFQAPALVGVIITLLEIFLIITCLTETLPKHKRARSSSGGGIVDVISHVNPISLFKFDKIHLTSEGSATLRGVGLAYFVFLFVFSGVEFTITFLVHERFSYDSLQQGKMFFFMGLVMALVQGGFVRRLRPGGEVRVAQMGMISLMSSFVITSIATNTIIFYIGLVLFSCGSATVVPCLTTLASHQGGEEEKGAVLGIFRSLGALARAMGPITACSLYWWFGPVYCYLFSTTALLVPFILLRTTPRSQKLE